MPLNLAETDIDYTIQKESKIGINQDFAKMIIVQV